jgi:hypothetical protein
MYWKDEPMSLVFALSLIGTIDHFEHESGRGVEDISSMARAMYGQDYFDRFSPDVLCRTLSPSAR